jgi:flagellar assembly protein FliH
MSLSKIIRNADDLDYHRVTMSDLGTVTQSETGGFVVLDSTLIEQPNVEHSASLQELIDKSIDELKQKHVLELESKFQQGRKSGVAEAEKSLSTVTKSLASACDEISNLKAKMLERSQADMLRLVLAIAERVVQANIKIDPEVVTRTVKQAIHLAVSAEEFHIKVNPEDLQVVNEHKPLFIASLSGLSNIEFVPDATIVRGGCILESPVGRVDATVEAQMEAISTCLHEAIKGE